MGASLGALLLPVLLRFSTEPLSPKLIVFFLGTASEPPKPETLEVAACFMAEPRGVFLSPSLSVESWMPSLLLDFYLGSSVDASKNFFGC